MYECNRCSGKYKNSRSLAAHRDSTHEKDDSNNLRFEPYPTKKYKCLKCGESFPNLTTLFQHKQKDHPGIPIMDPSLYDQSKSDDHSKSFISSPSIGKTNITPIIINHSITINNIRS